METITPEEMAAGSQPTRGDLIMFTPVEEILQKDTWDDIDVEVLVRNRHILDAATLEKLGITTPEPLAPEAVEAATAALGPIPEEPVAGEPEVFVPDAEVVAIEPVGEEAPVDNAPETQA